jgi:hypothetical protein
VTYQGGTLVAAPKVVTVTFPGDTMASSLAQIGASLTSSAYWDTIRAGYCGSGVCVGDGTAGTAVALTTPPAGSYTDSSRGGPSTIQALLTQLLSDNQVPAPDASTIYALYFPATTTIDLDGQKTCVDVDGYHDAIELGPTREVLYAVIAECAPPAPLPQAPPLDTLGETTMTASHEIIETATDGSEKNFGFYLDLTDPATWGWNDIQGGELADLCVDPFGLGLDETKDGTFAVQRVWSTSAAAAGQNPCVPVPAGEVYFNAFPTTSVVVANVGESKTIEVQALADGPMGAWTVSPQDWTDPTGASTFLSFSVEGGTDTDAGPVIQVKSGDRIRVTVTLTADPGGTMNGEADGVIVSANGDPTTATQARFWPFIVLTTAEAQDAGVTMARHHGPPARRHRRSRLRRHL